MEWKAIPLEKNRKTRVVSFCVPGSRPQDSQPFSAQHARGAETWRVLFPRREENHHAGPPTLHERTPWALVQHPSVLPGGGCVSPDPLGTARRKQGALLKRSGSAHGDLP